MCIHRLHDAGQHQQEADILVRRVARVEQVDAAVRRDGPVVVLAGAVHAGIRFLMQKTSQVVMVGDPFHGLHHKLVVVHRDIRRGIDRRQLVLRRSHLVMLRLRRHPQLPKLFVQVLHVSAHALLDYAEIVILHLLPFRSRRPEQGPAREHQVLSLQVQIFIDKEILLLRADGSGHLCRGRIAEQSHDTQRLTAQHLHGAQQRRLLIQRVSRVGAECGGDAEDRTAGGLLQKRRGSDIPRRVASRLEGRPQTAGGERGCVRLSLDQLFSGKLRDHLAVLIGMGHESVVLLRRDAGQRLEPVGIVSGAVLHGPGLHLLRHHVRSCHGELAALIHDPFHLFKNIFRQTAAHLCQVKHVLAKQFFHVHYIAHNLLLLNGKMFQKPRFGTSLFLYSCIQLFLPLKDTPLFFTLQEEK